MSEGGRGRYGRQAGLLSVAVKEAGRQSRATQVGPRQREDVRPTSPSQAWTNRLLCLIYIRGVKPAAAVGPPKVLSPDGLTEADGM